MEGPGGASGKERATADDGLGNVWLDKADERVADTGVEKCMAPPCPNASEIEGRDWRMPTYSFSSLAASRIESSGGDT